MKIPLNRIVAFAGPYISIVSAAFVAWLVAKLNVLGIPGLGDHTNELATGLTAAGVWTLTAVLTWLGQSKWLRGVHVQMVADAEVTAAALAPVEPEAAVSLLPAVLETGPLVDPEAEVPADDLPDEEEFASQPPEERDAPVQPSQVGRPVVDSPQA